MTPETEALIARVRELDAKATKGRWKSKLNHAPYKCVFIGKDDAYSTLELKPEDADLIAHYRTAAPALATALEAAEKRADAAEAKLKESSAFFEDAIGEQIIQAKMWKGHYAGDPEGQKDEAFWDGQERAFEMCLNLVKSALTQLEP